jgi:molybdate transport system substrate-binding protein
MSAPSHPPAAALHVISSMATRQLLAELAVTCQRPGGPALALEALGGVDAARRVLAGEAFDVVVLAADAIDKLLHSGAVKPGSRVDLVHSAMAAAVRQGAPLLDISSEAALKDAVLEAHSLAYSTGPSGTHLMSLFARWGISDDVRARTVQAPPGVPVATLVASGAAELGFQQWSELQSVAGVSVLGALPGAAHFVTTFAGAVCTAARQPDEAAALLACFAAPHTAAAKRRHGMQPA